MFTLTRLWAFDGPNIYGPQPGVVLHCHAASDYAAMLRVALKDAALRVGVVVGYLHAEARRDNGAVLHILRFATPTPVLGAAVCRFVLDDLNARAARDETWDADEALWLLGRERRAAALPVAALQLLAEANRREVPAFVRPDGAIQLGHGRRGLFLPPDAWPTTAATVDWGVVGAIPLVAISGDEGGAVAPALADALARCGTVGLALDADFDTMRALLSRPDIDLAVVSLHSADLLHRGFAGGRCVCSAVLGLPLLPDANAQETAQALGIPLLLTAPTGVAVLRSAIPELAALAAYAPCPVLPAAPDPGEIAATLIRGL